MNAEVLLAAGYAAALIAGAFLLEWLSAHTHRRSLRYRTAGFSYDETARPLALPGGRAPVAARVRRTSGAWCATAPRPTSATAARARQDCTDSDRGREIVRPLDPWPHSEAGRFHRGIALLLVGLAALVVARRGRAPPPPAGGRRAPRRPGVPASWPARWLARDLRAHPSGFPAPSPAHGLRMAVTAADDARPAAAGPPRTDRRDAHDPGRRASSSSWSCATAAASLRVLREYERGRGVPPRPAAAGQGPGPRARSSRSSTAWSGSSLRTVTLTIPPQEVITRDNVPARVAAVCYFRVVDPAAADHARSRRSRPPPRRSRRPRCGRSSAAPTSTSCSPSASGSTRTSSRSSTSRPSRGASRSRPSRSRTSRSPRRCSARWRGRPRPSASAARRSSTPRASSRPPRSSPTRRRSSAASPPALQLRYLQTLVEIGADQNSTIVFPLPLDLIEPFLARAAQQPQANGAVAR